MEYSLGPEAVSYTNQGHVFTKGDGWSAMASTRTRKSHAVVLLWGGMRHRFCVPELVVPINIPFDDYSILAVVSSVETQLQEHVLSLRKDWVRVQGAREFRIELAYAGISTLFIGEKCKVPEDQIKEATKLLKELRKNNAKYQYE